MKRGRARTCSGPSRWIKAQASDVPQNVTVHAYGTGGGTMENDATYYRRRAREQRKVAAMAGDAELRRRHLELADLLSCRSDPRRSRTSADAPGDRTSGR